MRKPRVIAALCAASVVLASTPVTRAHGEGVSLTAHATYGLNVQYTDVWYHRGLAFIGTWTGPGKVFIVDPTNAAQIGVYQTSNNSVVRDLQAQGDYLYVALDSNGLDVVDISDPASPARVSTFSTGFSFGVHDLFVHGNIVYAVEDVSGSNFHVIDVTNKAAPVRLTTFDNPGGCHDMTVVGNRAYLANLSGGFQILDVTNPAQPVSLATKNYPGSFTHNIWPNGDGRYVCTTDETCGTGRLRIWDVQNLSNIVQVAEYMVPNQGDTCVHNAMWVDNYIYMSYYNHGLRIVDATNPAAPVEVAFYETHGQAKSGVARHDELGGCFDGAWGVFAERSGPSSTMVVISDIGTGFWSFDFPSAPNLHYDGVGIYNVNTATFFLKDAPAAGAGDATVQFGPVANWTALTGDWDGNGSKTIGLYDRTTGTFFLKNSNAPGPADVVVQYGPSGANWTPIAGDWDGNDTQTVGLYEPTTGTFYLRNANAPGAADIVVQYGAGGSAVHPIAGDWDNDGDDTVGIYSAQDAAFHLRNANSPGPADVSFVFGAVNDNYRPVVGDWDGFGGESVGLYDRGAGNFFLRNTNAGGVADLVFQYGPADFSFVPVTGGDWKGPGI